MKHILFLCSGNYYRSRFAEAVFNHLAIQRNLPWRAFSRGLAIWMAEGDLSTWTKEALHQRGIDRSLTGSTRVRLTESDLQRAHKIIAVKEAEHRSMMRDQFPMWEHRVDYWTIDDLDCAQPEEALPLLEARVRALAATLEAEPGQST